MIIKKMISSIPFAPLKEKNKYFNFCPLVSKESPEWLLPSIKMYWQGFKNRKHEKVEHQAWVEGSLGLKQFENLPGTLISWMGHASMLIRINGLTILTDPIIESPSFLYKRILPFATTFDALPKIDVVLISHNHRDHMDTKTLLALFKRDNPLFLVPEGDKNWFLKRNITKVEECTWWEQVILPELSFTFVPAYHWSQRGLFDHNKSLWGGWVIKSEKETIYFAGDTAYQQEYFTAIGTVFPEIDIVLMPIGPCEPFDLMYRSHVNAEQAAQAFLDCKGRYFIPMHWGTFYFGVDLFEDPLKRIYKWWQQNLIKVPQNSLYVLKVGQLFHLDIPHKSSCSNMHDQNHQK